MRALLNVEETLIALTYRLTKLPAISLNTITRGGLEPPRYGGHCTVETHNSGGLYPHFLQRPFPAFLIQETFLREMRKISTEVKTT